MSKEQKEKVVENTTTDSTKEKNNMTSFFSRFKKQVKTFNLKNNESTTSINNNRLDESALEKELREKEKEVKLKEKELKQRALELENAKKKFEEQQRKIEEERKKNELARAERERLEKERIAREKELERQRIEKERAAQREKERLEKERIAREKELERQRIEKEKAEKREKERLEKERIAREKELERQRIEKEKAEKREKERLEKERIAREKELERQRIEKEQAEKRKREYRRKEKEFQILEDKKKIELLQKENEIREHENTLLSLQTTLISLEDKIEEKKLTISTLKYRNADKEKITLEEKRLNSLITQKQITRPGEITQKDITSEKKIIEKIQKNLEMEYKLDGIKKEIHSIKKEVVNGEETAFKVKYIDNKIKNIFLVSLLYLKAYISKKIFRKNVENYNGIKKVARNIKVRIATSLILAIILSLCFLVTLKFISSAKEHYVSFGETNTTAVDTTEEMKKQKEAEEKAKILEAQEKAAAARIDSDAQDEEITEKLAGSFTSYTFDVDRQVTVNKKIHAIKSASWSDQGEVIEPGTKLTVNKIVSPAGYLMYQISSGNLQGQFITANEKFVSVDSKNDQLENFISRPVAIKFLATQNVYSDETASKVRVTFGNGAQLNINGIGINNNRLIYHVSDGSFVPVNPVRVIEVSRETPKTKNIDSNDNKNASNSQNNQRTTR